jgi:hypothetical protein
MYDHGSTFRAYACTRIIIELQQGFVSYDALSGIDIFTQYPSNATPQKLFLKDPFPAFFQTSEVGILLWW